MRVFGDAAVNSGNVARFAGVLSSLQGAGWLELRGWKRTLIQEQTLDFARTSAEPPVSRVEQPAVAKCFRIGAVGRIREISGSALASRTRSDARRGGFATMASGWDPRTPPAPPPADPEQRRVIEKLAEFRARNGADFEAVVRAKQAGNPQYAFLFREGPEAAYYRRCLGNLGTAGDPHSNPPGAPVAVPPPPPHPGLQHGRHPPPPHPPPHPPARLRGDLPTPPEASQKPPESDPTFHAGLLPALVRAANGAAVGAYAPVDASRASAAEVAAGRAAASLDAAYLDERLRRFAEDLKDGGRSRRHRREMERANADAAIRERHREAIARARRGSITAAKRTRVASPKRGEARGRRRRRRRGRGPPKRRPGSKRRGRTDGSRGESRGGRGVGGRRVPPVSQTAIRGVSRGVARVEVGKGVDAALVARAVVRHSRAVRLSVVDSAL